MTDKNTAVVPANKADKADKGGKKKKTLSDVQQEILKYGERLQSVKHIDGKDLAINYIFPLLRLFGEVMTDQDTQIMALGDGVQALLDNTGAGSGEDDDEQLDELLHDAIELITRLAGALDTAMCAAGFLRVRGRSLVSTGVLEKTTDGRKLIAEYGDLGQEVPDLVKDLNDFMEGVEDEEVETAVGSNGDPDTARPALVAVSDNADNADADANANAVDQNPDASSAGDTSTSSGADNGGV